jgi:hypothetical protein
VIAMKKYFRPIAYSVITLLVALAMFAKNPPETSQSERSPTAVTSRGVPAADDSSPLLGKRSDQDLAPALFAVDKKAPPPAPPVTPAAAEAPPPDIKILGWMLSESVPHVFVDWKNESFTLIPGESLDQTYRFDKIGAGFADFTYLPTGETRRYTVSDPALIE